LARILMEWLSTTAKSDNYLNKLDDLGIADNTILIYTTDNGAQTFVARRGYNTKRTQMGRAAIGCPQLSDVTECTPASLFRGLKKEVVH